MLLTIFTFTGCIAGCIKINGFGEYTKHITHLKKLIGFQVHDHIHLEIILNQTIEFAPIILLGAPVEVIAYKGLISAVWGMYIHCNVDIQSGWLQKIINGPEMHRWHHSTGKGRNRNFATKFAFWDWMFGTAYLPETKPDEYGLKTFFPAHYFSQTLFAFRSFKKIKKGRKLILSCQYLSIE
ncbi:MAG: sterol desaturase family protein [Ignavibacteriales bacterium]|nr:sterol desaturase family protein [Ignavibacteriales bacterium]